MILAKKRLIPTLLLKDGRLVKTVRYDTFKDVGDPVRAARVYDAQGADELIFLDISASREGRSLLYNIITRVAEECFMPLTVGGGIRTVVDIKKTLRAGADRVCINTQTLLTPGIINQAAEAFGASTLVVSIDAKKNSQGAYGITSYSGKKWIGRNPVDWAEEVENRGAGEIFLSFVNRDGTMGKGYDNNLLRQITDAVSIPVIASGGVGRLDHFVSGILEGGASAVAAASIFHFTDQSPIKVHAYMADAGIEIRTE